MRAPLHALQHRAGGTKYTQDWNQPATKGEIPGDVSPPAWLRWLSPPTPHQHTKKGAEANKSAKIRVQAPSEEEAGRCRPQGTPSARVYGAECIGHEFNLAEGENTSSTIKKHP